MTKARWIALALIGVALLLTLASGIAAGIHCGGGCGPTPGPIVVEVDAGPLELETEERRQAEIEATQERIAEIETAHQAEIERMNTEERAEYKRVRELAPEELEQWLRDFDSELRSSRPSLPSP